MNIIPETDRVVRNFLPCMLQAAGHTEPANKLQGLKPIQNIDGLLVAISYLETLSEVTSRNASLIDERWDPIIEDAIFWCKAAIWAAARHDLISFHDHILKMNAAMNDGMEIITMN